MTVVTRVDPTVPIGTEGAYVRSFIEDLCRPSKTDQPLVLRPWQAQLIDDIFELGPDGRRKHRIALVGMPRKNGKSTLGAALALYGLLMDVPHAEVYSVAGDRAQAHIVFNEAKAMIEAEPDLAELCRVYRTHIEVPSTGSIYRVLSSDAPRAQGLNPSFVVFDEVHVQPNRDLWDAMRLGMGFREQPLLIGITTAGFDRTSLAWQLYAHGKKVQSGEINDPSFFFRWWEPSDSMADWRDPEVWRESNPAYGDFLRADDFIDSVRTTPESQFRRFRLNQWTTTMEAWLPHGVWAAVADRTRRVGPDEPIVLGFDGAWTGDTAGLIGCTVTPPHHLFVVDAWEPDVLGNPINAYEIETAIAKAFSDYNVIELAADPHEYRREIATWIEQWPKRVEAWPTNSLKLMVPACREFYEGVVQRFLTHDGDARLARHIGNAVVKTDRFGMRITKDATPMKIDLAVAAIIAYDRARNAKPRRARGFSF